MTAATLQPATHAAVILGEPVHYEDRSVYAVHVGGRTLCVRDTMGTEYMVKAVGAEESHKVYAKAKRLSCDCKGYRFGRGKLCCHCRAVAAVRAAW